MAIDEAARNVGESGRRNRLEQNRRKHLKNKIASLTGYVRVRGSGLGLTRGDGGNKRGRA